MATVTREPKRVVKTNVGDRVVTLDTVEGGLDLYLKMVGDQGGPRIKYHNRRLTLVSPSRDHERASRRLDLIITAICEGLRIRFQPDGSTLYRLPDQRNGIEPDSSYYIQNESVVRDLTGDLDLTIHPPPDLAVEIVVSHRPDHALRIYQELGVPEVWVYEENVARLVFHVLQASEEYVAADQSRAFPLVRPEEVQELLLDTSDILTWLEKVRAWVSRKSPRRPRKPKGKKPR